MTSRSAMRLRALKLGAAGAAFTLLAGCSHTEKAATTAAVMPESLKIWPKITSKVPKNPKQEKAIAAMVAKMTLEQKVAQMMQPDIRWVTVEEMRKYGFGSYQTGGDAYPDMNKRAPLASWVAMADKFYDASVDASLDGSDIPTMWESDAVHGLNNVIGATIFPHNSALGAMRNPALIKQIGQATALEVRTTGIDAAFAPTLAVARDDHWGRAYESYSENPALVKAYAGQMVEGLQGTWGKDFLNGDHVIATAKHFLGDGGTDKGVDQGNTLVNEQELFDIHAQGYVSAIEAGTQTIMASFNSWQGTKLHGHKYLLTDVLKNRMGFDGVIVGDWNGHGQVPSCSNKSCAAAVNAGMDIFLVPKNAIELYNNTLAQVKAGDIPLARIDDAVTRILRVKMRAGLFDGVRPSARPHAADTTLLGSASHRAVARQAVSESLVLLKNKSHLLPLSPSRHYLVMGNGADNIGKQTGGWTITWQGADNKNSDFPGATSILAGIKQTVDAAGGSVQYSETGDYKTKPDVAIFVYGEDPYAEGVGDIAQLEYQFPGKEDLKQLKKLQAQGIPVVSVFLTGRPLWANKELNASDAFVVAWLPGTEGGGIADVIFTDKNGAVKNDFKGKLPFSWPKTVEQLTLNVGDAQYDPLFAYDFGMTYKDSDTLTYPLHEQGSSTSQQMFALNLFHRKAMAPWEFQLSDQQNLSIKDIDRRVQGDSREVVWQGKQASTLALRTGLPQNFTRYMEHGVISLELKVSQAPTKPVYLGFGCTDECTANSTKGVEIQAALNKLPLDDWKTLSVDLSCFTKNGVQFFSVIEGFSLSTAGPFKFSFSNIQIKPDVDDKADIICKK